MIKAFVFDMDGLLVETESTHVRAFEEFMRRKGIEPAPGYVDTFVGYSIRSNVERIQREMGLEGDTSSLIDERNALYLRMLAEGPIEAMPGVKRLFEFARAHGLAKAVCSSSDRDQLDAILPRLLTSVGETAPVEAFFDVTISGNDVTRLKPAPDLYLECASRMGLEPEQCVAFEDSAAGASAASAAGMPLVVVPNRYSRHVERWPTPYVVASLSEAIEGGVIEAREGVVRFDGRGKDYYGRK